MQDICRTLKLHKIVVNILTAVSQEVTVAMKMHKPLYGFLRWFCSSNPRNQMALYASDSIPLFVEHFHKNVVCLSGWSLGTHTESTGGPSYTVCGTW